VGRPPDPPAVRPAPGHYAPHAAFGPDGKLILTICLSAVPTRSPYQAGDWVVCHGYPGAMPGPRQWGWRGYVLGGMGSTILRGITDDGREWAEHWGALQPDGTPCPAQMCVCHPHPRRYAPCKPRVEQLDLFGLAVARG